MKKTVVRILAFLLVLILALGIIPLGALAIEPDVVVGDHVFNKKNPTVYWDEKDAVQYLGGTTYKPGDTIKINTFDSHYFDSNTGEFYDFQGISSTFGSIDKQVNDFISQNKLNPIPGSEDEKKVQEYWESLAKKTTLTFSKNDIKIDPFPVEPDPSKYDSQDQFDKALEAYNKATSDWYKKYGSYFIAGYTPHQHKLSRWYSDGTTHWRECLTCQKVLGQYNQFLNQNWHSDGDEDRVCDVCGADIPYHEITVIDSEGGKITVNLEEAPHRKKITASVELEDGYKLKKLHFTKVRTDGSRQEIKRRKTDKTNWWTYMPTYDLEVTAEYVKK